VILSLWISSPWCFKNFLKFIRTNWFKCV